MTDLIFTLGVELTCLIFTLGVNAFIFYVKTKAGIKWFVNRPQQLTRLWQYIVMLEIKPAN